MILSIAVLPVLDSSPQNLRIGLADLSFVYTVLQGGQAVSTQYLAVI